MSVVHLHLMLNHVPVIGMLFVLLILAVAAWRRDSAGARLGLSVLAGLAVVTAFVFLTGEPAEEAVEKVAGVSESVIHSHEEAAELALIATGFAGVMALAVLAAFWRRELSRPVIGGVLALVLVVGAMLGWTANLGGRIRHTEIGSAAPVVEDDDRGH
jgi:hypothetical protein